MTALGQRIALTPRLGADRPLPWVLAAVVMGAGIGVAAAAGVGIVAGACVLLPVLAALFLRPGWLPVLLMVTVFTEALSFGGLSVSRLAGPLALVILLLRWAVERTPRLPDRRVAIAVAIYAAWAATSMLWTVDPTLTVAQTTSGGALASLALSAIYLVAVALLVTTERELQRLLVTIWALAVLVGVIAIGEYLSGSARAVGVTGDPNFFASLQVVALPLATVLASQARSGLARAVYLIGLGIVVGSVVTSLSRGGILALVGVFMLLGLQPARAFFRTPARKRVFLVAMLAGALALLAVSYGALSARTSSLFTTADGGSGRANLWRAAIAGFDEHPVRGLGFGAFPSQSNDLMRRTPGVDFTAYQLRPTGQYVHNAYLESLVEVGVVGLVLFLVVLLATWATLRRTARRAAAANRLYLSSVARALIVSLAGFAFTSLFLSTETDRTLWVLMGLALALPRVLADEEPRSP
jgi:O-antigen ligase